VVGVVSILAFLVSVGQHTKSAAAIPLPRPSKGLAKCSADCNADCKCESLGRYCTDIQL